MPPSRRTAEASALGGALSSSAILCATSLALLHPIAREVLGAARLSPVVFWGLPLLAGLLAAAPAPSGAGWTPARGALLRLLPFCAAAFACDQGFLGAGHLLGWVTFTYGEQQLVSHPLAAAAWGLPLCLLLGVTCYERALRGRILAATRDRWGLVAGLTLSTVTGVVLALPGILLGTPFADPPFVAAAIVTAACREVASGVIFLSGGGILLAGLYRGFLSYFEGFVLNDVNALVLPMANYTSSEPRFYVLRAGLALAGAVLLACGGAWTRRRSG